MDPGLCRGIPRQDLGQLAKVARVARCFEYSLRMDLFSFLNEVGESKAMQAL